MYKHLFGDFLLRRTFNKVEKRRLLYKSLASNFSFSFKKRCFFRKKLFKLGKKLSKSKIKNYCLLTGRSRGVLRQFKLARMASKTMLSAGFFSGFRRASW